VPLIDFSTGFKGGPSFYTGTGTTNLVPSFFPVALNGRPYLIDTRSGRFSHQYEQRVRDQSDISTAPGEASINPQGLWRRGSKSWHLGAGQLYADDADADDFRFYKSKGVNPWVKGQLSLLNATKLALSTASTNLKMLEVGGYLYVADGQTLKFTQDPFASSPSWTNVTGSPAEDINDITTDGDQVYVAYEDEGILMTAVGGASMADHYATSGGTYNYTALGFAKGYVLGFHNDTTNSHIHVVPYAASTGHGSVTATIRDPAFICAGFAGGQNHIYVAGRGKNVGLVYKLGIKTDGTVDVAVVALELPTGEYPTAIHAYLGFVLLGTNKGVRFCTADSSGSLVSGPLIATTSDVQGFTSEGKHVWFGWTNYEGSSGLGRLDLTSFTQANAPAYATDLMYSSSTAAVQAVASKSNKRIFTIYGVGVVVEDSANLVTSGSFDTGYYTWGIPDKKFIPRFDVRTLPLTGTVSLETSYDNGGFDNAGSFSTSGQTEFTFLTDQERVIEAGYRLTLTRASATSGPTLTRWMARAYAAPRRSQIITLPVLLHEMLRVENTDFFMDVETERELLESLVDNPRIVVYQERNTTYSVIVEDVEWTPIDTSAFDYVWEGTAVIIMRTVAE
jgi:hypothetical protein